MSSLHRWREDVVTCAAGSSADEKKAHPHPSDPPMGLPQPVLAARSDRNRRFHGRIPIPTPITHGWTTVVTHVREKLSTPASEMPPLGNKPTRHEPGSPFDLDPPEFIIDLDTKSDQVDEVVVDRSSWGDEDSSTKSAIHSSASLSRKALSDVAEPMATGEETKPGFWARLKLRCCRWAFFKVMKNFFVTRFPVEDPLVEERYQKEMWAQSKRPSLWASVFFFMNWILSMVFISRPMALTDQVFYFGVASILTVPLLFFNIYDLPRRHSVFYQIFLSVSTWSWSFYQIVFLHVCNGYDYSHSDPFSCTVDDFLPTFYYASALLAVALFGLHLKRLAATISALSFLIVASVLVTPKQPPWTRNIVNTIIYDAVLLYMHYQRELSQRRLFSLRLELNRQCSHTQDAMERAQKEADSKRRLTSYVFHEVRVPLNTALLAVQNMEGTGAVSPTHEVEFNGLRGSLAMMSKVLNDVLDFNRMDSGRFESVSKPYAFHSVMNSLLLPTRMATDARELKLEIDLDPMIDNIARRAEYEAKGDSPETIQERLTQNPSGPGHWGTVMGDETRLRQILTNLTSNAIKFTSKGGRLRISTKLVHPPIGRPKSGPSIATDSETLNDIPLSEEVLTRHQFAVSSPNLDKIVVRVEVTDTGSGIKPSDLAEFKLFSAFNQTEQGRLQGGKGTGLGLALVRQIVRLSHGKLGVRSKVGRGSTFWFELPLGIGKMALEYNGPPAPGTAGPLSPNLNTGEFFEDAVEGAKIESHFRHASQPGYVEQTHKLSTSSSGPPTMNCSALHGLMDQGGRVELVLTGYDANSTVPTRMTGDSSPSAQLNEDPPESGAPVQLPPLPGCEPENPPASANKPSSIIQYGCGKQHNPILHPVKFAEAIQASDSFGESLPLTPAAQSCASTAPQDPPSKPSAGGKPPDNALNILVVDDDGLTRTLMRRMLSRLGHNVSTAENGAKALSMILGVAEDVVVDDLLQPNAYSTVTSHDGRCLSCASSPFHLVFLDNQMPVCTGLQVARTLRRLGRDDLIVGVTGNALLPDQREYEEAGANHILVKPVTEKWIRSIVQTVSDMKEK